MIKEDFMERIKNIIDNLDKSLVSDKIKVFKIGFQPLINYYMTTMDISEVFMKEQVLPLITTKLKEMAHIYKTSSAQLLYLEQCLRVTNPVLQYKLAKVSKELIIVWSRDKFINVEYKKEMVLNEKRRGWNSSKELAKLTDISYAGSHAAIKSKIKAKIKSNFNKELLAKVTDLPEGGRIMSIMQDKYANMNAKEWLCNLTNLPYYLKSFQQNAIVGNTITKAKKKLFGYTKIDTCTLCGKASQNLEHILCACGIQIGHANYKDSNHPLNRITYRHNQVLYQLYQGIKESSRVKSKYFVDLPNTDDKYTEFPVELYKNEQFTNQRPDLIIEQENEVIIIELTSCFDTNVDKWNKTKMEKYNHFKNELHKKTTLFCIEVGALGVIINNREELKDLCSNTLKIPKKKCNDLIRNMTTAAVNASFNIYKCRDTPNWSYNAHIYEPIMQSH